MTPEIYHLIPGYLSNQLTPPEKALFEAQLNESPELRFEVEELRSMWQGLGLLPEEQPSAAMRASFYQKLNDIKNGRSRQPAAMFAWWKPGLSGLVRQIAIAIAVFALGLYIGRINPKSSASSTDLTELQSQVQNLRQTVALSLLDRQSAASRLEGVSWSSRVERPDHDLISALLNTLNHDQNTNVRLASLDALEKFSGDAIVRKALVDSISTQDSPLVQIALIDALVHMRDKAATGELRKLSGDSEVNAVVRQRAEWGVQRLSF